jgi:hypothetical protein
MGWKPKGLGSFPVGVIEKFYCPQDLYRSFVALPASYPIVTGGSILRSKAAGSEVGN